ncbi:ABC transporter related [Desulfatibacillum aliphaticivorans]|uniref:ABC transporter related n=1 Tax=Desulfatibacillum aliphaticivorans TaxID=218208 RepID=B8FHP8_DESAL|nr:ABC transporter ATP-binding protein [Desulfatibacillum aliphaticivorans]ACL02465.1 ABC transporter related [Desulfatibacillum aliphaticivorans]
MTQELLTLHNATYQYPDNPWRLEPCSLAFKSGEVKAVIGPNGSGKSTLLKLAAHVIKPGSGKVVLDGREMKSISNRERARVLGYLPQHVRTHLDYTVGEVVSMGRFARLRGAGFLDSNDLAIVENCLEQTRTTHLKDRSFTNLSGGERQRVVLASVLAQEPRVLLLDEPTSAMDMHHEVSFFQLLDQLVKGGMAVGVVTHDLNIASVFAHTLTLMRDGAIVQEGSPRRIITPEVLSEAYGPGIEVMQHPTLDVPVVFPAPGLTGEKGEGR